MDYFIIFLSENACLMGIIRYFDTLFIYYSQFVIYNIFIILKKTFENM